MKLTPDQALSVKEWNEIVTKNVESAIGSELNGKFTAANYPAGFNYVVKQTYYNPNTLKALDNILVVKDGIPGLESGYSSLYKEVIDSISFKISNEDQERINIESNKLASLVSSIITAYNESGIAEESKEDPTVASIIDRVEKVTKSPIDKVDPIRYPYLSTLCNLLCEYTGKAVFTSKIQRAQIKAENRLRAIAAHIEAPAEDNGGLKIAKEKYSCGWDNINEPAQLLKSLEKGNSTSFTFTASNFCDKSSTLTLNNKVHADIPVNWIFHMGVDNDTKYDLNNYTANGAQISVTVTYNGITTVPAIPTGLSADNKIGWYVSEILEEAAAKTGKDVTGYQLISERFDSKTTFGKNGKLRRMKTLVISQLPSIKLRFSKFDCTRLQESFKSQTEVNFQIFGGLINGSHDSGYTRSKFKYDESSQSLEVEFTPPKLGSSGTASNQTAYVLGGVIDYIDNEVEVNKIRLISDESDVENMIASEEDSGLRLKYRKNKDGRYEFAGLYDEKEDMEYQLGDTVAVPMTSRFINVDILRAGTLVENVQRSTDDECLAKGNDSWIQFWSRMTGIRVDQAHCAICRDWENCIHRGRIRKGRGINNLVGAHVVISGHNVIPNEDELLYIIPLCKHANNYHNINPMQLQFDVPAIVMDRFLLL